MNSTLVSTLPHDLGFCVGLLLGWLGVFRQDSIGVALRIGVTALDKIIILRK